VSLQDVVLIVVRNLPWLLLSLFVFASFVVAVKCRLAVVSARLTCQETLQTCQETLQKLESWRRELAALESGDEDNEEDFLSSLSEVSKIEGLSGRVYIPVTVLEFESTGNTLWLQSPAGATIMRIKSEAGFALEKCQNSPTSHFDLYVPGPISICLSTDARASTNT